MTYSETNGPSRRRRSASPRTGENGPRACRKEHSKVEPQCDTTDEGGRYHRPIEYHLINFLLKSNLHLDTNGAARSPIRQSHRIRVYIFRMRTINIPRPKFPGSSEGLRNGATWGRRMTITQH